MVRTTFRILVVSAAVAALALGVVAYAESSTAASHAASAQKTIAYSRVVDLSHIVSPKIPLWPGDPHVVFTVVATMAKDGYYLRKFSIGEHSATHMNAPNSFISGK